MTSLLDRMLAMEKILLEDIPNKDKIIGASQRLSGLELNKLSAPVKRKFKQELSYLNSIVMQYSIKTFDDYDQISPVHLHEMVATLMRICHGLKKFSCSNYALMRGI